MERINMVGIRGREVMGTEGENDGHRVVESEQIKGFTEGERVKEDIGKRVEISGIQAGRRFKRRNERRSEACIQG